MKSTICESSSRYSSAEEKEETGVITQKDLNLMFRDKQLLINLFEH